jgi:5-oxopent-3-ene-1,2,5-tricarboxylate decarboxylase/2-hydroxyhepta-2,4-diene-1,7-dioate isomerase
MITPRADQGVAHAPADTPEVGRVAVGVDERVPQHFKDNLARVKATQGRGDRW